MTIVKEDFNFFYWLEKNKIISVNLILTLQIDGITAVVEDEHCINIVPLHLWDDLSKNQTLIALE